MSYNIVIQVAMKNKCKYWGHWAHQQKELDLRSLWSWSMIYREFIVENQSISWVEYKLCIVLNVNKEVWIFLGSHFAFVKVLKCVTIYCICFIYHWLVWFTELLQKLVNFYVSLFWELYQLSTIELCVYSTHAGS